MAFITRELRMAGCTAVAATLFLVLSLNVGVNASSDEKFIPSKPALRGSFNGYLTYSEVVEFQVKLAADYPKLCSHPIPIGYSTPPYSLPIMATRMSAMKEAGAEPEANATTPAIVAMVTSLIHAREPSSLHTTVLLARYLAREYGKNIDLTYLLDSSELWFIFVVNPSGYERNREAHVAGTQWPMHRRNTASPCPVDLNRNFGYKWAFNNLGSSAKCDEEEYRGSAAFSEPETQALRDFVIAQNVTHSLNYHAYGGLLMYPWSYADILPNPTALARYEKMTTFMNEHLGYVVGNGYAAVHYTANGEMDDWLWGTRGIWALTVEVGQFFNDKDGFWPAIQQGDVVADANVLAAARHLANEAALSVPPGTPRFGKNDIILATVVLSVIMGLVCWCWCCIFMSILLKRWRASGSCLTAYLSVQGEFCCCDPPENDPFTAERLPAIPTRGNSVKFVNPTYDNYDPEDPAYDVDPPPPAVQDLSRPSGRRQNHATRGEYDSDGSGRGHFSGGSQDLDSNELQLMPVLGEGASAAMSMQRLSLPSSPRRNPFSDRPFSSGFR